MSRSLLIRSGRGGRSRATFRCSRPLRRNFLDATAPLTRRAICLNSTSDLTPTLERCAVPHQNTFVTSAGPHPPVAALPTVVSILTHIDTSSLRSSRVAGALRQQLLLPECRSQGHDACPHRKTDPPYRPRHRSQ